MINELLFYNHFANGDLHVSRELVKFFISKIPARRYYYAHKNSHRLIMDLPVEQVPLSPYLESNVPMKYDEASGLLCLNTWYAHAPNFNQYHCSLNSLHALFSMHAARIEHFVGKIELPPLVDCIPTIDFSKYKTNFELPLDFGTLYQHVTTGIEYLSGPRLRVFISNGPVTSGQTGGDLGEFNAALRDLIAAHPNVFFLLTAIVQDASQSLPTNAAYTRDIIGLPDGESDLCENAYLSTMCEVIVGRGSGPGTFAYIRDNFMDSKKQMVCFTDYEPIAFWVIPPSLINAKITWSRDYARGGVSEVISKAIEEALCSSKK